MRKRRRGGLCPCGSKSPLLRCCGRFVRGDEVPASPAELMRSRYTAYALGNDDYIIATTDPHGSMWEDDESAWRASIRDFSRGCDFRGVDVIEETIDGDEATVRFHARLHRGDEDVSFEELSVFVRRDGRWLYHAPVSGT